MARRRREPGDDNVDLRAPEHAWWAARPTDPFAPPPEPEEAPADPPTGSAEAAAEEAAGPAPRHSDPYRILRLAPQAPWDDVVESYRRLARWWHPDGLTDPTDDERAHCEARLRELNEAYQALKVRRGR